MGFHHVAFASKDTEATHRFYTEAMGFTLEKVSVGGSPDGGWAKHFFFNTGDDTLIAFWEIHEAADAPAAQVKTAISDDMGLAHHYNHLAFDAKTLDELAAARDRWLANGYDVVEIDHEFCVSVYTDDPNGIMVEFCCTTRPFDADDRAQAAKLLAETKPAFDPDPKITFYEAASYSPA